MVARLAFVGSFLSIGTVLSLGAVGCSDAVPLDPAIVRPVVEPAKIAVNIHYAEDLRDHECTGDEGYIAFSWTFALGPPSIEMFNVIFTALFKDVEFRDTPPDFTFPGDQREVIELHLSEFTGCQASWPILGTTVIDIGYEAIVWSAEGEELARWNGRGRAGPGDDPRGYSFEGLGYKIKRGSLVLEPELTHLNALTSVAMRKAAAAFVVNYENDPAVRAWADE